MKRRPTCARRALVPSGKPAVAVPRPGVSGVQTVAVADVHGATTKFGAASVPLFAAVKPGAETLVLLCVLVRLNTSKNSESFIFSPIGKFFWIRVSKR